MCLDDQSAMQTIIVRPATPQDLDPLNRFQQAIAGAERPYDATIKDGPVQYYDIAALLRSDDVRFLVAAADEEIVACGFARIDAAKPYLRHRVHAYLGLMYVEPRYRGRSINLKIIDELKRWCVARNVAEMRLEVYHDNLTAIRAYEKAGFKKLLIEMRLGLGAPAPRGTPRR
jgi:ribosomal protein S18 acetylase RimI-like enzyme